MRKQAANPTPSAKSASESAAAPIKKPVKPTDTSTKAVGEMCICIEGIPFVQKRARVGRRGTYDPTGRKKGRFQWKAALKMREKGLVRIDNEPIGVEMAIHVPFQKNASKRQQKALESKLSMVRGDIDNYVKAVFDALNGLAYLDDRQIVSVVATTHRSVNPRVELKIYPIEDS